MPSSTFNVLLREFFTLDKLRLFQNYSNCVRDLVAQITNELGQPDCHPLDYKDLCKTFQDKVTDLVEEIHYLTEECTLPPCTPQEAAQLNARREEMREFAKLLLEKVESMKELRVLSNHNEEESYTLDERESDLENELVALYQREAELQARLDELQRR